MRSSSQATMLRSAKLRGLRSVNIFRQNGDFGENGKGSKRVLKSVASLGNSVWSSDYRIDISYLMEWRVV